MLSFPRECFRFGRLCSHSKGQARSFCQLLIIAVAQSIAMIAVFKIPASRLVLATAAFVVCALLTGVIEPRCRDKVNLKLILRLAILCAGLLSIGFLAAQGNPIRPLVRDLESGFVSHCALGKPLTHANWPVILARTLGLALCISEAGAVVQLLMSATGVEAPDGTPSDFKHSALIGSVERLLVFVFVTNVQYNAVAFILTAKGVVRLHETAKGQAAEYLLVGTLYSTLVAICVTLAVTKLT